jgi:hypothetical protein
LSHRWPLILLTFLLITACRQPQGINEPPSLTLTKGWKFKLGDDIDYSKTDLGGPGWKPVEVGKDWQSQGYPEYYGYAGYTVKTLIPSSLKTGWGKDTLKINVGMIAFYDRTYLNGHLLGQNNITVPDSAKPDPGFIDIFPGLFCLRCYKIAANDDRILWDKENTISVRVYSRFENGGLWIGNPGISMEQPDDFIGFDKSAFYTIVDQQKLDTLMVIRNKHPRLTFTGDLVLSAVDTVTKRAVFHYEKNGLQLGPNNSLAIPVSLPMTTDPILFVSRFSETRLHLPIIDSTYIPFVLIK